jgi:signal transduction histidine kinase
MTDHLPGRAGAANYASFVATALRPLRLRDVFTAAGAALIAVALLLLLAGAQGDLADLRTPGDVLLVAIPVVLAQGAAIAALPIVLALIAPSATFSVTAFPTVVAVFLAGTRTPFARLAGWAGLSVLAVAVGQWLATLATTSTDPAAAAFGGVAQGVVVVGGPLLPAVAIAGQRAARRAQQETLDALTRERDAQITAAIASERTAMARELHDIAAHHLSGITLISLAIERQITTDPDAAIDGIRQVRQQSKTVLEDLRRLVGLLRGTEDGVEAVKTLDGLPDLLTVARAAGNSVELQVSTSGTWSYGVGVSPLGQLAAYRMVQEALTNTVRYAPGAAATVAVDDTDPDRLRITVRNTRPDRIPEPRRGPGGFGVLGMQERAALVGGRFDAGPTTDDGWEARMSIPRHPTTPNTDPDPEPMGLRP